MVELRRRGRCFRATQSVRLVLATAAHRGFAPSIERVNGDPEDAVPRRFLLCSLVRARECCQTAGRDGVGW